jgi:hypothetical protein
MVDFASTLDKMMKIGSADGQLKKCTSPTTTPAPSSAGVPLGFPLLFILLSLLTF